MEFISLLADLKLRPILIIGGGKIAARKIKILIHTGAEIRIVAKKIIKEIKLMFINGILFWINDIFKPNMLNEVFLVIAATNNNLLNKYIYYYADKKKKFINVVDDKKKCSFIFPSIINKNPIIISISSSGKLPYLTTFIRKKIVNIIPINIKKIAIFLSKFRIKIKLKIKNILLRNYIWEKLFNLYNLINKKKYKKFNILIKNTIKKKKNYKGKITLVGAGPGNSGLLTLSAIKSLQEADIVLYDYLINKEIIDFIRKDCDLICVGKLNKLNINSQNKINYLLIKLAKLGKKVIRLKGGDSLIFGRGGEEINIIKKFKIPFKIIPGITAAIGIAAFTCIPLTYRKISNIIIFITGNILTNYNWKLLTKKNNTIIIYMGLININKISKLLIINGLSKNTSIAIIYKGTYNNQKIYKLKLKNLLYFRIKYTSPTLIIIGPLVNFY